MELCVVLLLSVLILSGAQKQKPEEKLHGIITAISLLHEELLEVIPSIELQEKNKTPNPKETVVNEILAKRNDTEKLAAKMDDSYERFFNSIMTAFRAEKMHRHTSENRIRRDLGALQDRLKSIIDTSENVTNFFTQTADVLRDLQDDHKELALSVNVSTSDIQTLVGKHYCLDKISDIYLQIETITNNMKKLDENIRNLNRNTFSTIRPVNIALHKPSSQSSNHYQHATADKGNDGDMNQDMLAKSCTHTQYDYNAWWAVDLEDIFYIRRVVIYNRGDCCGYRLANFVVYVSEIQAGASQVFAERTGSCADGEVVTLTNDNGIIGRYLKIQLRGKDFLQLCEVKVFSY